VKPHPPRRPGAPVPAQRRPAVPRVSDRERDELQGLLDAVPAPLEPFDVSSLDGFLCGVLLQPELVPRERWLVRVTDPDGRALARGFDASRLHALTLRRHAELADAIARRRWFDPWVFELDDPAAKPGDAVFPWVAGIAAAFELFPGLMRLPPESIVEPLALIYRHLDPGDLEDADALLAEIDTLEPVADLADAVEGLVRATLLLADVTQPLR
jgi:uncharacterized protein